jgi:hypothetical protein
MVKPYNEQKIEESVVIRTFSVNVDDSELQWHWDEEDRIVEVIGETDWMFQFDNELPITFNAPINIKAGTIHRVIKGSTQLTVKITKL